MIENFIMENLVIENFIMENIMIKYEKRKNDADQM